MVALTAMMAGASVDDGFSKSGCTPLGGATNGILVRSKPNDDKSKVDRSMLARSRESRSKVDQSSFDRSTLDTSTPAITKPMFTNQHCTRSEVFPFPSFPKISPCLTFFYLFSWVSLSSMYPLLSPSFFLLQHQSEPNGYFTKTDMCERIEERVRHGYDGMTDWTVYGNMMALVQS